MFLRPQYNVYWLFGHTTVYQVKRVGLTIWICSDTQEDCIVELCRTTQNQILGFKNKYHCYFWMVKGLVKYFKWVEDHNGRGLIWKCVGVEHLGVKPLYKLCRVSTNKSSLNSLTFPDFGAQNSLIFPWLFYDEIKNPLMKSKIK